MRVLLDECVPVQMRYALPGHEATTAQQMVWSGLANGDLLAAVEHAGFDLLILADKNLRYQQNPTGRRITILELWTNHRPTLEKHFPLIRTAAESIPPGTYCQLESL